MSDRPSISVVVPFFNSERTLAACVDSLLAQDDLAADCEIFVVDNGSADASASIAAGYSGITVLSEARTGAYAARNTAIRHASAPVIAFTDADCVVDRDWLRSVRDGMQDPTVGVLLGHCRYPPEASLGLRLLGAYENAKAEYVTSRCAPAHHFAYANNMAVRASLFERLGPFKEWKRAGDSELAHRLASSGEKLRLVYRPSMRVTHMEFLRSRDRARRLSLYTETNQQIETFRELGVAQRVGVLLHLLRGRRS